MILDQLTATLRSLGPSLKDHLWQTTVFSLGAVLVALAMRKNYARNRYWIWLTASVKFLIPFSILVSVGTVLRPHHQAVPALEAVYDFMDVVGQPFTATRTSALPLSHVASTRHMTFSWSRYVPAFIAFIWIIGTMSVLTTWGMYWWRIRQTIQRSTEALDGPELRALRELQQANGGHADVGLFLSNTNVGPGLRTSNFAAAQQRTWVR